jgi:hypothetical protein
MSSVPFYLLDADSFIRSKRQHYAFDFCPGFWDALLRSFREERLCSIEPVKAELQRGKDDLADWVADKAPKDLFGSVEDDDITDAYADVIRLVQANAQYNVGAKQRFASGADPWLVAYAVVHECVITTHEVSAPQSKATIKLPDVAVEFDVECVTPFEMLRELRVRLRLEKRPR